MRRLFTISLLVLSAVALIVGAPTASAATGAKPSITRVLPMRVSVGNVLTIQGRNFRAKRTANTVIFRASNGRSAFAKPRRASRKKLVLAVPGSVSRLLAGSLSKPKPTRLKLRVLAGSFSKFTPRRLSPVVTGHATGESPRSGPAAPGSSPAPGGGSGRAGAGSANPPVVPPVAPVVCDSSNDHDRDMLPNALEAELKTDPCLPDTDGDKVLDGYEYKSAVDLNNDEYQQPNRSLPYPGKRPYPNPLDPSDANTDFDGDSLALAVEQRLWLFSTLPAGRVLSASLSYSDGLQHSIYTHHDGEGDRRFPSLPALNYPKQSEFINWAAAAGYRTNLHVPDPSDPGKFPSKFLDRSLFDANLDGEETVHEALHYDLDGSDYLSDEERDEDADGLLNFDENTGRMQTTWWTKCYTGEKPFYVAYQGTDPADPDSDGDGVRDGADDQDHDDVPNLMELSRIAAAHPDPSHPAWEDRQILTLHTGPFPQNCKPDEKLMEALSNMKPPENHPGLYGRVNPFNPCLPLTDTRTCTRHQPFDSASAPFDGSPNWLALN